MAIHYVDSNAAGTNAGTSWTNAAESIDYLFNTISPTFADGDYVYCAHDHSAVYSGAGVSLDFGAVSLTIVSVNSGTDVYEIGAKEEITFAGGDYLLNSTADAVSVTIFAGMHLLADDDYIQGNNGGKMYAYIDCTIGGTATGSAIAVGNEGQTSFLRCKFRLGATQKISIGSGASAVFRECSADPSHTKVATLLTVTNRQNVLVMEDCDLDSLMTTTSVLKSGAQSVDGNWAFLEGCKVPTGFSVYGGATTGTNTLGQSSSMGTAAQYYNQYHEIGQVGISEVDTTQYVVSGADVPTYDGTNEFSIQIDTDAEASTFWPFRHKLMTIPKQDVSTAKTVTVEIYGPSGLTDSKVWLEVKTQKPTDKALKLVQSAQNADPLAAGTALAAGAATWAVTTETEYKLTLDIGAQTGITDTNVDVYICVGEPSITVNASMPSIAAT